VRLLVYAITDSTRIAQVTAAGGLRVKSIRIGRLTAIVASRLQPPAPAPRNLRQYHQTLAAMAATVPAILPMRFGTLVDEEELAFILRTRAATLRAALARVRGRVQMTVRIIGAGAADSASAPSEAIGGGPATVRNALPRRRPSKEGPGTRYLRKRMAAEDPGTRRVLAPLRHAVRQWVADEQVMSRSGVTSVYHLVPRRSAAAYARAVQQAAREAGIDISVSGPFPPYAFAATF
jgi:hypothetical protein